MYLDTHAVVWLYSGDTRRFPVVVRRKIERAQLLISPAVLLELQFLYEINRLVVPGGKIVDTLAADIGLQVCDLPFARVVAEALHLSWTRDPFDRLIVAQAMLANAPLLTKDATILEHCEHAVWSRGQGKKRRDWRTT
jgi:PIN domain nuclease of toxin-antitoxin system